MEEETSVTPNREIYIPTCIQRPRREYVTLLEFRKDDWED